MPRYLKRSANQEPSSQFRTRQTTKRDKRNKSYVDEEVGDVIVIARRGIESMVTVEDINLKTTPASVFSGASQKARDAFIVLDSAPNFAERERNRLQNNISLYLPSPDGESRQSRIIQPSINTHQSAFATRSSSGLAHLHTEERSSLPTDAPDDCQLPPQSARLSSGSQQLSPAMPALEQYQPNPNTLQVRDATQSSSELSATMRTVFPPQSRLMAEGDHCSAESGISGASTGRQASQPACLDNPPLNHTGVLYLGTVRNDKLRTRSCTQVSDLSDDPQAFQLPGQAFRQNISVGGPWTGKLTSQYDQPAQQSRKLGPDGSSKASQSQGITPVDPNTPQRSSTGTTSKNHSMNQTTRLGHQPLLEQNAHTSLSVSYFPGPALPLQASVAPLPKPSKTLHPQMPVINNRMNGTSSTADVRLVHIFTTHAIVLLRLENLSTRHYPASVVIRRTLQNFYQWYITETRGTEISDLKFKLLDDPDKSEKEFSLPEGDLQRFQTLKQYIWDCFWAVRSMNGGGAKYRILITPVRLSDEDAPDSSQTPGWSGGNAIASYLTNSPPASILENISVAADQPLPAITISRRHYGPPSLSPPSISNNDDRTWMNVVADHFERSRMASDKKRLRDSAVELIAGRVDIELEDDETTGGRKRMYPDACGVVVDRSSAKGLVTITAQGFSVQQVDTGPGLVGDPYAELTIGVGQTCIIHGSSTVLYYKPREVPASNHAQPFQSRAASQTREWSIHELENATSSPPEIAIRLQINEVGKFSAPYEFSVWNRRAKTTEFYAWFGRQTGRGGVEGPPVLTFTLKDAMPARKSRDVAILNEDDFRWMRKHIIKQFDLAKSFIPGLRDFTVLVTDPGWV